MKKTGIILLFISVVAVLLRFVDIGTIPSGIHHDEAAFGYNALSLLKTGRDEYGKTLPIIMKSFGDYKGALYSYLTIPFVFLFGLSEWTTRIVSGIAGVCSVILIYFLVKKITKTESLGILSAALACCSPVSILLSREAEPALLSVVFVLAGLYFLFLWMEKNRTFLLFLTLAFWCVSMVTYFTPRIVLLGLVPLFFFCYRKKINLQGVYKLVGLYSVLILCNIILFFGVSGSRFGQISVFQKPDVMLLLEEKYREDGMQKVPLTVTRALHNKAVDFGRFFFNRYIEYMNPDFLFFDAQQPKRERVPDVGVLMLIELPFLLFGLFQILKGKYAWGPFILLWFIGAPVFLSFATDETPNIHRFSIAVFPVYCIVALGIRDMVIIVKKMKYSSVLLFLLACVFIANAYYCIHQLFVHQPIHFPFSRGYAYKELVDVIYTKYYSKYEQIVVTKSLESPYIYFLFYRRFDPKTYQEMGSPRDMDYSGFDKFFFVPQPCPIKNTMFGEAKKHKKIIFIQTDECSGDKETKILDVVRWKDGSKAFQMVEYVATEATSIQ